VLTDILVLLVTVISIGSVSLSLLVNPVGLHHVSSCLQV
jgi:hypothetical protein